MEKRAKFKSYIYDYDKRYRIGAVYKYKGYEYSIYFEGFDTTREPLYKKHQEEQREIDEMIERLKQSQPIELRKMTECEGYKAFEEFWKFCDEE